MFVLQALLSPCCWLFFNVAHLHVGDELYLVVSNMDILGAGQPFGSKCENGGQCYGAEGEAEGEAEGGSKTGSALTCFAPAPEGEAEGGR